MGKNTFLYTLHAMGCVDKCSRARQSRFGKPHASYYFKQQSVPKGFVFIKQGEKTSEPWSRTCKSTKDDKSIRCRMVLLDGDDGDDGATEPKTKEIAVHQHCSNTHGCLLASHFIAHSLHHR